MEGVAWIGVAWRSVARMAWHGGRGIDRAWHGEAWHGRRGMEGVAWIDVTWRSVARKAWHGERGMDRCGIRVVQKIEGWNFLEACSFFCSYCLNNLQC